ncbi:MAG: hypothetical protein AB7I33_04900 [Gemmatimonadales bacterium]
MKIILLSLAAFLVALGAGTGAVVLRSGGNVPAADSTSTAIDSTEHGAVAVAAADSQADHGPPPSTADTLTPRTDSADAGAVAAAPPEAPVAAPIRQAPGPQPGPTPEEEARAYGQVARILVNMKPADAARILGHLSDAQVEGIFRQLGVRQTAQLMGQLPVERAAALSRRLLATTEGTR